MKTRKYNWLDTRTNTPKYGVQIQLTPGQPWMNVCDGDSNVPCIYDTEKERDEKMKELYGS